MYWDIAVMAVPEKKNITVNDVTEITQFMDSDGILHWNAPAGKWTIYRYGYAPTMAHPHPLPDDIIGKAREVDKMSREDNIYHWKQLLDPLKENIGEYFGNTFRYIWVDSYESGYQNWTKDFREQFRRLKNYDVLRWITLFQYRTGKELEYRFNAWTNNKLQTDLPEFQQFLKDYDEVVNRLYMDNGFAVAKEMLHACGLQLYWEPYGGPFSNYEGAAMADVPVDEFWSSQDYVYPNPNSQRAAVQYNKRIVAAEAFTGSPSASRYTETPAFLKHTADGGFAQGLNLYFLHHWVHQPFDDKYQPGLGMGWWGTHFSRFQTWYKESRAFFTYLSRCQMLLQQGSLAPDYTHRVTPEADIYFVTNPFDEKLDTFAFAAKNRVPQLWDAYTGKIMQTNDYVRKGDSVFVVFPANETCYATAAGMWHAASLQETAITGKWRVTFFPKTGEKPFTKTFDKLVDFSKENDFAVKYFSGTAVYEKDFKVTNTWANRLTGDEQYPADFEWGTDRGEEGRAMKAFPLMPSR